MLLTLRTNGSSSDPAVIQVDHLQVSCRGHQSTVRVKHIRRELGLVCFFVGNMASFKTKNGDIVVAVDFGTTRTAVAYSIVGNADKVINVLPPGKAGSLVQGDHKTPTSLLMDGDRAMAFGYRAEEKFAESGYRQPDWRLFKTFKMELYKASTPDPDVQSMGNRGSLPLSRILMESLNYMKNITINHLKDTTVLMSGNPSDVSWVLTLPAIWSQYAKAMMRKAAFQAGLIPQENSDRLMLVLEPECAAIASQMWGLGTRFLIADCGGGTLDITSHEVVQPFPLKLKEIGLPSGGPFGAKEVDRKFFEFISSFLGADKYYQLEKDHATELFELSLTWEKKKVQFEFDPNEDEWTEIGLSSILDALDLTSANLMSMVERWNSANPTTTLGPMRKGKRKIALPLTLMKSFFMGSVKDILGTIAFAVEGMDNLKYVILAGGFGRCSLIKSGLMEALDHLSTVVIHAREPDLCIVKGAAMFGCAIEGPIISRKSKYTFGISTSEKFNPRSARHRKNRFQKYLEIDGMERLRKFSIHGRVGDDLSCHNHHRHNYYPLTEDHRFLSIHVLVTEKYNVFLHNEPGVHTLCRTVVDIGDMMDLPFKDRGICVQFSFGGPEVWCRVYDKENKKQLNNVKVDFQFF